MSIQNYAANTNNAFLLNDTVVIAQALLKGLDPTQIQRQASEGLLEHRSRLSRQTFAREILKRLNGSEVELLEFFLGNSELRRVANLYTILRHHRLLREFFVEVLQDKRSHFDHILRSTDVSAFFTQKLDQNTVIASWSDSTLRKAQTNILQVLSEARVLDPIAGSINFEIVPVFVPIALRSFLESVGRSEELLWFS